MASTRTKDQKSCSGESCVLVEEAGTSVVLDSKWKNLDLLGVKLSKKITLLQEPKETLLLLYSLEQKVLYTCSSCGSDSEDSSNRCHHCQSSTSKRLKTSQTIYSYNSSRSSTSNINLNHNLTLTFDNNLHEISQNYGLQSKYQGSI